MYEKYDLRKMLEEIREDEQVGTENKKLSQDTIHKMMLDKLKKRKTSHEQTA